MVNPKQIREQAQAAIEKALIEIEFKMDRALAEAAERNHTSAFVIVEDYSIAVQDRLFELADKYNKAGWVANFVPGGHFIVRFNEVKEVN